MQIQPTKKQLELAQKIHEALSSGESNGYTIVFDSDKDAINGVRGIQKALQGIGATYNVGKLWEDGNRQFT